MKKRNVFFPVILSMTIFCLILAACPDPGGGIPLPELTGDIWINNLGSPFKEGSTFSAGTGNLSGTGEISYEWLRGDTQNGEFAPITGATNSSYNLTQADQNKFIRVRVSRAGNTGTVTSGTSWVGVLLPANTPELTGNFSVNGDYVVGSTLTANISQLSGSPPYTYQWFREINNSWNSITGATNQSYTLVEADEGCRVYVRVTKDGHAGSRSSNPLTVLAFGSPPPLTGNVSFSTSHGSPYKVGLVLTAYTNNLGGSGTISYVWLRGDTQNGDFAAIQGETSSSYTVTEADSGKFIRVRVSRTGNTGTVTSGTFSVGTLLPASTPELGGSISFIGDFIVGQTVSVNISSLTGSTGTIHYQWYRETAPNNNNWNTIPAATGSSYTLTQNDLGLRLYVRVTRDGYAGARTTPNSTPVLAQGSPPQITGYVWIDIRSNAKVGDIMTAWTENIGGSGTISFIWQRGESSSGPFTNIAGASSSTYTLQTADEDSYIRLVVERENNSGTLATTYQTAILPASAPVLGGSISFTGDFIVGQTVSVNISNMTGSAGTTHYQWYRETAPNNNNWNTFPAATGSSYTLTQNDLGLRFYVRVTRDGHADARFTSNSTPVLAQGSPPQLPGNVWITVRNNAKVGDIMSANTYSLGGTGDFSYVWQRGDSYNGPFTNTAGASGSTYTLQTADEGKFIRLVVSRSGNSGTVSSTYSTAILPASAPVLGGEVTITGNLAVGQIVTADTSGVTGTSGNLTFMWYRSENVSGNRWYINGATESTYTLTSAEQGMYITVYVSSVGSAGELQSEMAGPVTAAP